MLLSYSKRWLWLVLFLWAVPAQAQDFKTHYDLAMALYQAQRYADAIPEFKAAYDLEPKPGLLFNMAQSYRKAGRLREAILYYDQYLSSDPRLDTDTRRRVDSYLAEARNTLASLELELKQRLAEDKAARTPEPPPTQPPVALPPPAPTPGLQAMPPSSPGPDALSQPVYKKWWFWTVLGGVVAGSVIVGVGVGAATSRPSTLMVGSGIPQAPITF